MRVLPKIDAIDKTFGLTSGGQELIITGWGLEGESSVQVDGVDCEVQSSTNTEIRCLTGAKDEPSIEGY